MNRGVLGRASTALAIAAGWALLLLAILITFEVLARKFARFSTQGADEIGGYVFAITSTIGFSYAFYRNVHVRVDLLIPHLPRPLLAALNLVALILLNLYVWVLTWRATAVTLASLEMKAIAPTILGTPLVIPQTLWTLSLLMFAIVLAGRLFGTIRLALRGEFLRVADEFGAASVEEARA